MGLYAARHTFYIGADGRILYIDTDVDTSTAGDGVYRRLVELGLPRSG
jgi:hypothetical protein